MVESELNGIYDCYRRGSPAQAVDMARAAIAIRGEHGALCFALGCCLERQGQLVEADRAFRRGSMTMVEPVGMPFRVSAWRFKELVGEAISSLPHPLREAMNEVSLVLGDYPEDHERILIDDPEPLGMFCGPTKATARPATCRRGFFYGVVPTNILARIKSKLLMKSSARSITSLAIILALTKIN